MFSIKVEALNIRLSFKSFIVDYAKGHWYLISSSWRFALFWLLWAMQIGRMLTTAKIASINSTLTSSTKRSQFWGSYNLYDSARFASRYFSNEISHLCKDYNLLRTRVHCHSKIDSFQKLINWNRDAHPNNLLVFYLCLRPCLQHLSLYGHHYNNVDDWSAYHWIRSCRPIV